MYAIVDIKGNQEKVEKGMKLKIAHVSDDVGTTLTFDKVLLTAEGSNVSVGTPLLSGASVTAKILGHGKDDKVLVVKMRRRKRYRRTHGHRQQYTEVEVTNIA